MSTGRVHAKIALVTGGGSGIGGATAILLANEGEISPCKAKPILPDRWSLLSLEYSTQVAFLVYWERVVKIL